MKNREVAEIGEAQGKASFEIPQTRCHGEPKQGRIGALPKFTTVEEATVTVRRQGHNNMVELEPLLSCMLL